MYTSDELYALLEEGLKLVIVGEAFTNYEETNEIFQEKLQNRVFVIWIDRYPCKFIADDSVEYYIFDNYKPTMSRMLTNLLLLNPEMRNIMAIDKFKYVLVEAVMNKVKKMIYNKEVDDIELFVYIGFNNMLINALR